MNEAGNVGVICAETVPEETMSGVPTTPRRFRNWLDKQRGELPAELYNLGLIHHLCLNTIALNRNDPDALKAAKRINAAAMREFMTAYAAWKKQN